MLVARSIMASLHNKILEGKERLKGCRRVPEVVDAIALEAEAVGLIRAVEQVANVPSDTMKQILDKRTRGN